MPRYSRDSQEAKLDEILYAWGEWRRADGAVIRHETGAVKSIFGVIYRKNHKVALAEISAMYDADGYIDRSQGQEFSDSVFSYIDLKVATLPQYLREVVMEKYAYAIHWNDTQKANRLKLHIKTFGRRLLQARTIFLDDPEIIATTRKSMLAAA